MTSLSRYFWKTYLTGQRRTLTAPAAWRERYLQMLRSFAATSASSTDHPHSNLLMSFLITSLHDILGRPGLRFPWTGFQVYSFLGIRSMSMRCTCPNHWRRRFLITDVSWGCFVLVLMVVLEMCWDQVTLRIFPLTTHACQKHLAWTHLSPWVSSTRQHTGGWRVQVDVSVFPHLIQFSESCWCFTNSAVQLFGIRPICTAESAKIFEVENWGKNILGKVIFLKNVYFIMYFQVSI